ncbi:hypothetical protein GCM10018963_64500 [Saccharothrix longispora]
MTAEPRTTASTGCPCRRASDNRSSTSTPTPSPSDGPSAAPANDLLRPSGATWPALFISRYRKGVAITATPPASARSHSPRRSAWLARCTATSADEQAVSTDTAGPSRPSA